MLTTVSLDAGNSIFAAMLDVIRTYRVAVPPALGLALRSLLTLEGCLTLIAPGYSLTQAALQQIPAVLRQDLNPRKALTELTGPAAVVHAMTRRAPSQVHTFVDQLLHGRLGIRVRTFDDERERAWVGALVAEVIGAGIAVSLLIVAALLAGSETGPVLTPQVTVLSFLGAVVGLGGFLLLMRSIRRILARVRT